jgi:hypothetical protein
MASLPACHRRSITSAQDLGASRKLDISPGPIWTAGQFLRSRGLNLGGNRISNSIGDHFENDGLRCSLDAFDS